MRKPAAACLTMLSLLAAGWATPATGEEAPAELALTRTVSRLATWPAGDGAEAVRAVHLSHFAEVFDDIPLVHRLFLLSGDGTRVVLEARLDLAARRLDWSLLDDGDGWWARLTVWPLVGEATPEDFVERVGRMFEFDYSMRFETANGILMQVKEQRGVYDIRAELGEKGLSPKLVEDIPPGVRQALLFLETSLVAFEVWQPEREPYASEDPVVGIVSHIVSRQTGTELPPRRNPTLDHLDDGAVGAEAAALLAAFERADPTAPQRPLLGPPPAAP